MNIGRRASSPVAEWSALGARTQPFEPRHPLHRPLTPPPSAACLRGVRRPTAGGSVLAELNARRIRSERCGAMEVAGALHLALAAPSVLSSWAPERPRHAAAADALLRRHLVQLRVDRARLCVWRHGSLAARSVRTLRAACEGMRRVCWPRRCVDRARSREDVISPVRWFGR